MEGGKEKGGVGKREWTTERERRVGKEEGTRVDRRIKEGKRDGERMRERRKDREGVRYRIEGMEGGVTEGGRVG